MVKNAPMIDGNDNFVNGFFVGDDPKLAALAHTAQEQGFLTYDQVCNYLPDENGEEGEGFAKMQRLHEMLQELNIRLTEAEQLTDQPPDAAYKIPPDLLRNSITAKRDPIRMYLSQMGETPLLMRKEEILLAKKLDIQRQRFQERLVMFLPVIETITDILDKVSKES